MVLKDQDTKNRKKYLLLAPMFITDGPCTPCKMVCLLADRPLAQTVAARTADTLEELRAEMHLAINDLIDSCKREWVDSERQK